MKLVINADDFGLSEDTVAATIECFERGALTSATIMPGAPATESALAFALASPQFSFGVHLTFVGDGPERPLSPPADVPTLVDEHGCLLRTRPMRLRALTRRISLSDIEREASAQIGALAERGLAISHVDSHRHLHKFAPFRRALAGALPRFGIRRVRNVQDLYLRRPARSPTYWLGPAWQKRLERAFETTDHFYMPGKDEDRRWDAALVERLEGLPGDSLEVGVHPGYEEPWRDRDRRAVQLLARTAEARRCELVDWRFEALDRAVVRTGKPR